MFTRRLLHCSFCGKDETQVSKLVAGPKVYICDACVTTARKIMDNADGADDSTPKRSSSRWRRLFAPIFRLVSS
jgi:ATP-dependent protease Clp ATPase subunit